MVGVAQGLGMHDEGCCRCAVCLDGMQASSSSPAPTAAEQHHFPGMSCQAAAHGADQDSLDSRHQDLLSPNTFCIG